MHADQRAGSAHSSNQQAVSTRSSTQDYLEQERSTEADAVPPLPEPMQVPARQVMSCDNLASFACVMLSLQCPAEHSATVASGSVKLQKVQLCPNRM